MYPSSTIINSTMEASMSIMIVNMSPTLDPTLTNTLGMEASISFLAFAPNLSLAHLCLYE